MTLQWRSPHPRWEQSDNGTQLLVREGKQFSLSAAGEKLYAEAQDILLALSNLDSRVRDDSPYEGHWTSMLVLNFTQQNLR